MPAVGQLGSAGLFQRLGFLDSSLGRVLDLAGNLDASFEAGGLERSTDVVVEDCALNPHGAFATAVEAVGIPARPKVAFVDGEHSRLFPEAIVRVSYESPGRLDVFGKKR